MLMWFVLVAYIFILKLSLNPIDDDYRKKRFLILAGIGIALVMGLRGDNYANVYDLRVYKNYYSVIQSTAWDQILYVSEFEWGFAILNKLLSTIFRSSQTIVIFEACFCVYAVTKFIYKNTYYVFEAVLFFVTLGAMGFMLTGLRQSISIAICLLSVELIKEKKFIKYCIATLIASSIHRSALIFIVGYFVMNFRPFKQKKWLNILMIMGMVVFSTGILKLGNIFSNGEISESTSLKFSFNGIVVLIIYAASVISQISYDKRYEVENTQIATMTSVGFGLYFLRFHSMVFERIAFYYSYGHIVALTSIFDWIDNKDEQSRTLLRITIYLLCVLLFWHRLKGADYGQYVFFWS